MNKIKYILLLFLLSLCGKGYAQYSIHHDVDNFSTFIFGPSTNNGFQISLSLVALFTAGSEDRNGFRLGAGITLSQTIDYWKFAVGMDAYKAKQNFGLGTGFAGIQFNNYKYGASYYLTKYYQNDQQISGIVGIFLKDFQIRFEDDILSYPFVGFKIYDRYRSAAFEIQYKNFIIGTNIYTTDLNGVTDISNKNSKGIYKTGYQISSPLYAGYKTHDFILRLGINNKLGGLIGQNSWHRFLFQTPDFKSGSYNSLFVQLGVDKPYTLY